MQPSNILKIESLSDDWCDKDVVILHACFQILKDYVEDEKEIFDQIDWEHSEESRNAKKEIHFLYDWWVKRIVKDSIDEINEINDLAVDQYDEDDLMLKRLIDLRKYLWT